MYTNKNAGENRRDSVVSDTNRFINFWLRLFDTRRETQFLKVFANHTMLTPPQLVAHLVMFKISIHLCRSTHEKRNSRCNGGKFNSMLQWQKLSSLPPSSNLNWLFFKIAKLSGPSLPGITSSTLQPHFLSRGLLWQWWWSYPLRASVKLHPMTIQLNS